MTQPTVLDIAKNSDITYTVIMYEKQSNQFMMTESVMTGTGLLALLRYMTDMNRAGRVAFMYELQRTQTASYIPEDSFDLQYSIAAIERKKS